MLLWFLQTIWLEDVMDPVGRKCLALIKLIKELCKKGRYKTWDIIQW